jgi:hypothetical protein
MVEATRAKIENAAAVRKRIAALQSIASLEGEETSPLERMKLLKGCVEGFLAGDESLAEDPLFRIVNDLSARYMQVSSKAALAAQAAL